MYRIVAITSCPTGIAHTLMAAEALRKTGRALGHEIHVETRGSNGVQYELTAAQIAAADVVILATDIRVDTTRFAGKPSYETTTSETIRHTAAVITASIALVPKEPAPEPPAASEMDALTSKQFVAVTSCPTGIAHTFMAAEALAKAARALGHAMKVETQGSVGAKNLLTAQEIAAADAVIIAADTTVDLARFAGKRLYFTSTNDAMHDGRAALAAALTAAVSGNPVPTLAQKVEAAKTRRAKARTGAYKHLMTGVSYMLPLVTAGGLAIALAFALGGIYAGKEPGTLAFALSQIGGGTAFQLFIAVLSGFIAYSIADRPGIAPGLVGGMLAQSLGAGFLGGIASGFLAGYVTKFLAEKIRLTATLEGLKPVLILPFLATTFVGLAMVYVIAPPVHALNDALAHWLNSMRGTNAVVLGLILGAMMAFDMGGPVNKAAYTFSVGLLASKVYTPMAAVMAAGMTPPLALALACFLFKNRFDAEERQASGPALVLGLSFITEGAIPFAAKDPLHVIPALMLGSAVAGAISMVCGVELLVPHGGIFASIIPGAVTHLASYLGALLAGVLVSTGALFLLKRPLSAPAALPSSARTAVAA